MNLDDELSRLFGDERLDAPVPPGTAQAVMDGATRRRRRRRAVPAAVAGALSAITVAFGGVALTQGLQPATVLPIPPPPAKSGITPHPGGSVPSSIGQLPPGAPPPGAPAPAVPPTEDDPLQQDSPPAPGTPPDSGPPADPGPSGGEAPSGSSRIPSGSGDDGARAETVRPSEPNSCDGADAVDDDDQRDEADCDSSDSDQCVGVEDCDDGATDGPTTQTETTTNQAPTTSS